jgi:hypothetical protein
MGRKISKAERKRRSEFAKKHLVEAAIQWVVKKVSEDISSRKAIFEKTIDEGLALAEKTLMAELSAGKDELGKKIAERLNGIEKELTSILESTKEGIASSIRARIEDVSKELEKRIAERISEIQVEFKKIDELRARLSKESEKYRGEVDAITSER